MERRDTASTADRKDPPALMWSVVEEHLDEAEFLWEVWERSLLAPHYTLDEVAAGPEERLLAHLDGLVVNGPEVARRLLVPALEDDEGHRVTAAAAALLLSPGKGRIDAVFEALQELPEQRAPIVRALTFAPRADLSPRLRALLAEADIGIVAAAAEVLGFDHEPLDDFIGVLAMSEDPAVRALALRLVPDCVRPGEHARLVDAGLRDIDPVVSDAALEAGVCLGLASAWVRARERALEPGGQLGLLLLALGGNEADRSLLLAALSRPRQRPGALWALGFLGTPEAVDIALEWLDDRSVGPLAGEVFAAITGVDLIARRMRIPAEACELMQAAPEDDLPWPDPMPVLKWWTQHRGDFKDGARYLGGMQRDLGAMLTGLERGPMRRRPALLLDLKLRAPAALRPRLQPRAPTRRQRLQLQAMAKLSRKPFDLHRPLA